MMVMDDLAVRIRDGIKKMKEEAELASAKAERAEAGLTKFRGEFLKEAADLKKQVADLQKLSSAPKQQAKQPAEDRLVKIEKSVIEINNDLKIMQKLIDDQEDRLEKFSPLMEQTAKGTKQPNVSDRLKKIESDLEKTKAALSSFSKLEKDMKSMKGMGDVEDLESEISQLRKETDEKFRDLSAQMENVKNFSTDIVKVKEIEGIKSQVESLKKERIDFMKQISKAQETFNDLNERISKKSSGDLTSDIKFKSEVGNQITGIKAMVEEFSSEVQSLKRRVDDHEYDAIGSGGPRPDDSVLQLEDRIMEIERSLGGTRPRENRFERDRETDDYGRRQESFRDERRGGYERQDERQNNIEGMASDMDRIKQRLDMLRQGIRSDMLQKSGRRMKEDNSPVVIE